MTALIPALIGYSANGLAGAIILGGWLFFALHHRPHRK
jgi:hypothetical protein